MGDKNPKAQDKAKKHAATQKTQAKPAHEPKPAAPAMPAGKGK